ncbi:BLUF domain-containing protein [Phaeobacter sp. BS52]|uniref:BLUF domain-containing protein n=1 Tax=Phaeobacter sp. BS52 TaxID=2907241 RepID=UPI00386628A7
MKHIVYVSQAEHPFSAWELANLLETSRARNVSDGISGLLIYRLNPEYNRGNFVQAIEGPEAEIDSLWSRITRDNRHHTIVVVQEGSIEARMFDGWSMGFKNADAEDLAGFAGFSDLGSDTFWSDISPASAAGALELLRNFYDGA